MTLTRRTLLLAGGASTLAAGCGRDGSPGAAPTPAPTSAPTSQDGSTRFRYGTDPSQFAELRMPSGDSVATVVLLHGGYWYPQYGLELMRPIAARLNQLGYATWNVEYRRIGAGGGVPTTLEDVARAVDRLAGTGLPADLAGKAVLLGHSAGGQLAAWAASRTAETPGGAPEVPLSGVISLSGVLDLTRAASDPRSSGPVREFLGGSPSEVPGRYDVADPALLVPASCRVWATYAEDDTVVSPRQSTGYVALARAAGGEAEAVRLPGDHFTLIDPLAPSFTAIEAIVAKSIA